VRIGERRFIDPGLHVNCRTQARLLIVLNIMHIPINRQWLATYYSADVDYATERRDLSILVARFGLGARRASSVVPTSVSCLL
jgi:hypothetical protein